MRLPDTMNAMILRRQGAPLEYATLPVPQPLDGQVLVKVTACGVCRTDLHIIDGELLHPKLPLVPGHEIVGYVVHTGPGVQQLKPGDWVGVPWLGHTCGTCRYCRSGRENLCEYAVCTGYDMDGGYAAYTLAWEQFCFPLAEGLRNAAAAPLLCAGLIGYRSYRKIPVTAHRIGFYGFGAAAHLLLQLAVFEGKTVCAFTRPGDPFARTFARQAGAAWVGDSLQDPPEPLDAAIIFAAHGPLVPKALADVDRGGMVVCGGIHMSDIPSFPYDLLWQERTICSVANLKRSDGKEFLALAPRVPVKATVQLFELRQANDALDALRKGKVQGAAVLVMPDA
ncbi:zinc-dependent alcohol dehydrogenase family protein [Niabella drilacis]|uniref:Alcohol dehydrogenase, propanol-preferring n=1 Tax=Niabella drilacis (strain DSM 25811 / CCM 8410 / CCUG 62505 / LMG 26954 / E90) TaxID=1285928 RepID=A0A1G6REV7_NIADE|nr:zinc-dependent alcohol dehydrogenase family protein [Niabella drilacis]SDD02436.1 alcohol dehydrogenase, propanol-preferring [Niabella drilacis]